eukprot:COSAG04_NODE_3484_length_2779_cov_18.460448_4_plen_93_part_00
MTFPLGFFACFHPRVSVCFAWFSPFVSQMTAELSWHVRLRCSGVRSTRTTWSWRCTTRTQRPYCSSAPSCWPTPVSNSHAHAPMLMLTWRLG